jgi:hypothetical protein
VTVTAREHNGKVPKLWEERFVSEEAVLPRVWKARMYRLHDQTTLVWGKVLSQTQTPLSSCPRFSIQSFRARDRKVAQKTMVS